MSVNVSEAGPFERLVEFSVTEAEIDKAKGVAARKLSQQLKIRGFRPGKAPRPIVEATVGSERLRAEAIDELLPDKVGSVLEELQLDPAVTPELEAVDEVDDGVGVKVRVTLWPELSSVPGHEGRTVDVGSPDITDEEMADQIDRIRDQFAELGEAGRPAEVGDFLTIDISATSDGEDVPEASAAQIMYELGNAGFIVGIDETLIGAEPGGVFVFDGPLPEGFGELAGMPVTYGITVTAVQAKVLPELTDEWVAEITEFSSIAELEVNLEERMGDMKRRALAGRFREKALDQLVAEVEIELPEALLRSEMDEILHRFVQRLEGQGISIDDYFSVAGVDRGAFIADLRSQAGRSIRTRLLLEGVAARAGLEVSDEELSTVIETLALQSEKPDAMRKVLRQSHQEKSLVGDILRNKALEAIVAGAAPVDEDGNPVELTVEEEPDDADGETVVPAGVPVADSEELNSEVVESEVVVDAAVEAEDVAEPVAEAGSEEE
ncbi:MAG: trigger factor [Acidimicrobiia bacterium]